MIGETPTAVVIVDPDASTGKIIAQEVVKRGSDVIVVWTTEENRGSSGSASHYLAQLRQGSTLQETADKCQTAAGDREIVACLAGGDTGSALAHELATHWDLRRNANYDDKHLADFRNLRQVSGSRLNDFEPFLQQSNVFPVIVKPKESSENAKVCREATTAKEHIEKLLSYNSSVLCQEYTQGQEYIVEHVSRDGVHKATMVWVYDQGPANGSNNVTFGFVPVPADSKATQLLLCFVRSVLDATKVENGPSFAQVILSRNNEPCLVSLRTLAHGGRSRPLCKALTGGYSQVDVVVDAYLGGESFNKIPDKPASPFPASGQEVRLVSFSRGTVNSTPGFEVIKKLPSFVSMETTVTAGSTIDYTTDMATSVGVVLLLHRDATVVQRDLEFIRYMEKIHGFFVLAAKMENLKRPHGEQVVLDHLHDKNAPHRRVFSSDGPLLIRHMSIDRPELRAPLTKRVTTVDASQEAVVVVDPYSTGCCIVEEMLKRGYSVLALWTKGFAPQMKLHVPLAVKGKIKYAAELDEAETLADTVKAVYKAAGRLRVVACMAGGEAGVDFADALSERMNLRTNGTRIPNKRDKKLQQELIKEVGMRSVRQACGTKFSEVEEFLKVEPFPVVLKPVESAGSDGVKLCHTFEEAKEHFDVLMNSQMVNGGECPAVLCQEFLRGKEYVVDHVSREGVHKTVMVWVYDKRPANGCAFVYFGCVPIDSNSPEAKILIPYVRKVLDALDLKNGPSHGEVMMTSDGPCLVEMNCRAHGGDGNWRPLCRALNGGHSQVETAVDSYLDSRQFTITPDKPPSPFKASGQEVILVSFSRGTVKATPGFSEIQRLESFVYLEHGVKPGSVIDYTVDLFTGIGSVILMHQDEAILQKDVQRIRQMERENLLFEYEESSSAVRSSVSNQNLAEQAIVSTSNRPELY